MKIYKIISFFLFFIIVSYSQDTVKIMAYNILNYEITDTSRHPYYRTVLFNSNPDILVVEEIISQNAMNYFMDGVLNPIGIGTFSAGTFINGYDSDNAIFFKSSKFTFLSNTPIHTELRDINEFKVVHVATGDTLRLYAVHLKANNTTADQQQRAREVDSLRKVTNALPLNSNFIVLGDFNFYSSTEPAYIKLLQVIPANEGYFFDMLNMPGVWNNPAYSVYHTQSSRVRAFGGGSTGGMDDRFDLILYSKAVNEQSGITVIPQSLTPYGNDGNHFNDSINRPPNAVVSQAVANALHYASDHLPVYALFKFESPIGIQSISSGIPEKYLLKQNYPNPFNPVTNIEFQIPNSGKVNLVVFDILGNLIETIVNDDLKSGFYKVSFDASLLSSGTYFYRISSGRYRDTKKMILIK